MRHLRQFLMVGLVPVVLLACACHVVYVDYTKDSSTITVRMLQLSSSDISGWKQERDDDFRIYVGDELFVPIDGGAPTYLQKGLIETGIQSLQNSDGKSMRAYIMDFGISANADAMFLEKTSQISTPAVSPSFAPDVAKVDASFLGGCGTYAHFGSFYFEVSVSGYDDQTQAIQAADMFLKAYRAKMR